MLCHFGNGKANKKNGLKSKRAPKNYPPFCGPAYDTQRSANAPQNSGGTLQLAKLNVIKN